MSYSGTIGLINVFFKYLSPNKIICIDLREEWNEWFSWFKDMGFTNVHWLDSDYERYDRLNKALSTLDFSFEISSDVVCHDEKDVNYYRTTLSQENGVVNPDKLKFIWKNITTKSIEKRKPILLQNLISPEIEGQWLLVDSLNYDLFLNGNLSLEVVDLIAIRLFSNKENNRKDALELFLKESGFVLLSYCTTEYPELVRAIYVRDYSTIYKEIKSKYIQLDSSYQDVKEESLLLNDKVLDQQIKLNQLNNENINLTKTNSRLTDEVSELEKSIFKQVEIYESAVERYNIVEDKYFKLLKKYKNKKKQLKNCISGQLVKLQEIQSDMTNINNVLDSQYLEQQKKINNLINEKKELTTSIANQSLKLQEMYGAIPNLGELKKLVAGIHTNTVAQIESYIALNNYFNTGQKLSSYHGWPISPDLALFIVDRMNEYDYNAIIEFGSGTSTELFAKIALMKQKKKEKVPKILSFDHLEEYYQKTMMLLNRGRLGKFVQLEYTPLVSLKLQGEDYFYYDCELVLKEFLADLAENARVLVLVDGPPGKTCKHARYPALPTVRSSISSTQSIVADFMLDDFSRTEEKEVSQKWINYLADKKVSFDTQVVSTSIKGLFFLKEVSFNN